MRVTVAALLLQLVVLRETTSTNVEIKDEIEKAVSLGGTVTATIANGFLDAVTGCFLRTRAGDLVQFRPDDLNTDTHLVLQPTSMLSGCSVSVREIDEEHLGSWELISHLRSGDGVESQVVQPFSIVDRDAPVQEIAEIEEVEPTTAEPELEVTAGEVQIRNVINETVSLGGSVVVTIANGYRDAITGCSLRTRTGDLVQFRPDNLNTDEHLELQPTSLLSGCSVAVRDIGEEHLGGWELISDIREDSGNDKQIVQPFNILNRDAPPQENTDTEEEETDAAPEENIETEEVEPTTEQPETESPPQENTESDELESTTVVPESEAPPHENTETDEFETTTAVPESETSDESPAEGADVVVLAGEEVTLSCSAEEPLEYCWFRAQNGTIFSVAPGVWTPEYEYVGAGLAAGACGVKLHAASVLDTGAWTCNVGSAGRTDRATRIDLTVHASPLVVTHYFSRSGRNSISLVVEGRLYNGSALDYCRFVNPRGYGFNSESVGLPVRYDVSGSAPAQGVCRVSVAAPGWEEHGVWSVAAAVAGAGAAHEISARTQPQHMWRPHGSSFFASYFLLVVLIMCINVLVVTALVNRRSRRWTSAAAATVAGTLRRSFRKSTARPSTTSLGAPPAYDAAVHATDNTTATAATADRNSTDPRQAPDAAI